jgi:hypothetical protein
VVHETVFLIRSSLGKYVLTCSRVRRQRCRRRRVRPISRRLCPRRRGKSPREKKSDTWVKEDITAVSKRFLFNKIVNKINLNLQTMHAMPKIVKWQFHVTGSKNVTRIKGQGIDVHIPLRSTGSM